MIWAFDYYTHQDEEPETVEEMKANGERALKGTQLFGKYFGHLWW